jgi:Ca2+-binding EF-hand superfamily protein
MAPEVWKGRFGPKSDVWSMGVVMFELITGQIPFRPERNSKEDWALVHNQGPNWDLFVDSSPDALRLCEWLLTVKEAKRPAALDVLEHPWLKKAGDREPLSAKEIDALMLAGHTWKTRNPMQRALSLKMAAGCTCLKKFATLFSQFDTDNSGILDHDELVAAFETLGMDKAIACKIADSLDVNKDGSCEYLEFAAAFLSSLNEEFDELLRQEFTKLDVHAKGQLTDAQMVPLIEELRPLALAHGLQLQDIDSNGDGVISFSEFCEYFGRPGAAYDKQLMGQRVTQLPMKQQIRIVREDCVEKFRSAMQASMDASLSLSREAQASGTRPLRDSVVDRILQRMQQHEMPRKPSIEIFAEQTDQTDTTQEPVADAPIALASEAHQSTLPEFECEPISTHDSKLPEFECEPICEPISSPSQVIGRFERFLPTDSEFSASSPAQGIQISQCSQLSTSNSHEQCIGCWLPDRPFRWFSRENSRQAAIICI